MTPDLTAAVEVTGPLGRTYTSLDPLHVVVARTTAGQGYRVAEVLGVDHPWGFRVITRMPAETL